MSFLASFYTYTFFCLQKILMLVNNLFICINNLNNTTIRWDITSTSQILIRVTVATLNKIRLLICHVLTLKWPSFDDINVAILWHILVIYKSPQNWRYCLWRHSDIVITYFPCYGVVMTTTIVIFWKLYIDI